MLVSRAAAAALAAFLALAPVSAKAIVYSVDIDFVSDAGTVGVGITGNVSGTFDYLGGGSFGTVNLLLSGTGTRIDGLYDTSGPGSNSTNLAMFQSSLGPNFINDPKFFLSFASSLDSGASVIGAEQVIFQRCSNPTCNAISITLLRDAFDQPLPTITALSLPPTMLLLATGLVAYAASRRRMA